MHKRIISKARSRRRTPWDAKGDRTATQEYLRMHYLERYDQRHPKRGEVDEAAMVNSYLNPWNSREVDIPQSSLHRGFLLIFLNSFIHPMGEA